MAKTGIFHHVGTFLLFVAAVLLLITTISAPVVNDISILRVKLANGTQSRDSTISFGTFGYCVLDAAQGGDYCTGKHIGYNPASVISAADSTDFTRASTDTTKALTRVMVLHPVATGLAFIAFLLALGSGVCGAVFAAAVATVAWLVTLVVLVTDFVLFGIIKRHVNGDDSGSHADFHTGIWTLLAAMILLFLATFIVLLTCCSSRMHRQDTHRSTKEGYGTATTTRRRHFWQRRSRY